MGSFSSFLACCLFLLLSTCSDRQGETGATCDLDRECVGGVCLDRWDIGYCSKECLVQVECKPWEICVLFTDEAHCYQGCWYDRDCWEEHFCYWWPFAKDGICLPR